MNPGQMLRHNRGHAPNHNRASGSQSPYQQQNFQGSHIAHQMGPTTSHHHQTSGAGYIRQSSQHVNFPLRILVQSNVVGAIIGRSGSTIKQVIQQSNARVDVHREDSIDHQEKVISISGSPDSCSLACLKIMEIIQNEKLQASANDSSSNHESLNHDSLYYSEAQLKILAHNNLIGRLIGRNGVSIKKIMDQTSTKINIAHNSLTDCTNERVITIVGNLEQVRHAEQIIFSRLRTAYMSDINVTMQAMSHQQYLFGNVPMSYMPGSYTQNQILSTLVNSQTGHSGHAIPRSMPIGAHQGQITRPTWYQNPSGYMPIGPDVFIPPSNHRPLLAEKETVNVYVPNSVVGAIIGKSGSAIREMIRCSGAIIKVDAIPTSPETAPSQPKGGGSSEPTEQSDPEPADSQQAESVALQSKSSEQSEDSQTQPVAYPQTESRSNNSVDNDPNTRKVNIIGTPEAQWSAQCMIFRKVIAENRRSDISLMVEIQVPSKLVGKIIGKGGNTIKNIQKQSRASVRLTDEKPNPNSESPESESTTSIQIIGDFQSSQTAQRQIRHLIKENPYRQQSYTRPQAVRQEENKDDAQETNKQFRSDEEHPVKDTEESSKPDKITQDDAAPIQLSHSGDPVGSQDEDEKQHTGRSSPANTSGDEEANENVDGCNNNTTEKYLNTDENLNTKGSPVDFEDSANNDGTTTDVDHKTHDKPEGCCAENGENVITIASCAKQKSVIDTSKDEPALINNGK